MLRRILGYKIVRIVVLVAVLFFIGVLIVVTRGGIPGAYAVTDGTGDGYIDINDGLAVGSHTVYLDSVMDMGFCVKDPSVLAKAKRFAFRHLNVQFEYRSVNQTDLPSLGCEKRSETIIVYLATDLYVTLAGQVENLKIEQALGFEHDTTFDVPPDKLSQFK